MFYVDDNILVQFGNILRDLRVSANKSLREVSMDTKIDIAQKLVKLNLKGLDVIKVAEITELPLKKVEKMYREAFIK